MTVAAGLNHLIDAAKEIGIELNLHDFDRPGPFFNEPSWPRRSPQEWDELMKAVYPAIKKTDGGEP
jgi:hypothetical protein